MTLPYVQEVKGAVHLFYGIREKTEACQVDWFELVGKTFPIHGVRHICIAADDNALLMLQYGDDGSPCQYVVAHGPYKSEGELCWLNGAYFPFFDYASTADALLAATDAFRQCE